MPVQIIFCAHAADNKQDDHKPGVQHILDCILVAYCCDGADNTFRYDSVKHVNHMINDHQYNSSPANIVYEMFPHLSVLSKYDFTILLQLLPRFLTYYSRRIYNAPPIILNNIMGYLLKSVAIQIWKLFRDMKKESVTHFTQNLL